jgi:hypothetical protein
MTRARALKQVIRARAAKTGERYTTARRHVLNSLQKPEPALRAVAPAKPKAKTATSPISDAKIAQRTGHGLDHWFAVLDTFDAMKKGHTAAARHLYEGHGVDGWYAQGITVAYERARGVRAANQRCDGEFEVSVSKVIASDVRSVVAVLTGARQRARLKTSDDGWKRALAAALDAPASKGFVIRPDGLGRFRYKWGDTTVQFYLVPKPGPKVSVVVTNAKLASGEMVEERRAFWREVLNSLAATVAK